MTDTPIITQKMIADALKIGKTTVSLALSGNPRIPQATRDKVHAMARTLGYKPHSFLTDLTNQRWKRKKMSDVTIGYICESQNMRWGGVKDTTEGVILQAAKLGYHIDFFYFDEYPTAACLQKVLLARGIEALIINGISETNTFLQLDWHRFITVSAYPLETSPAVHAVVQNHYVNFIKAWRKAVEYGYVRIGTILLDHGLDLIDDDLRLAGLGICQKRLFPNLAVIEPLEITASLPQTDLNIIKQIDKWVKKNRPDAVIGFHGGYHFILRDLGYGSLGFINLHLPLSQRNDPCHYQSGMEASNGLIGIETVNLLHMCRKTNQWGIPDRRIDHTVGSVWREGSTLPRKK